ncbi:MULTISPECIES: glycosyltransferase [Methylocaldum]|jgi:UDP:flavonoid glycosyltransferase YjiC (YdhE family)|uniref:glycosyltransferase n=1 Tax=unclassified Methylocaldum TaxID=2622260 RepID=UPI00098B51A5|nr:glycosyltransferase [Methylocaldum sp. 14B]
MKKTVKIFDKSDSFRSAQQHLKPKKRILFIAEAVTLAHVARPYVLASSLDSGDYDVHFACDGRFDALFSDSKLAKVSIRSISPPDFLDALAKGKPVYDTPTLRQYVKDDLRLIEHVNPDLIVGDFRLSLTVSARLAKVPYANITNIYWSPYAVQTYPVPEHVMVRLLGPALAQPLFDFMRPLVFASHTLPLNRIRKEFGLTSLGSDLRVTYTDGDYVLYADIPGLVKTTELPPNHYYLGPILWSPETFKPDWWSRLERHQPIIYLTLGSSGETRRLPELVAELSSLPVTLLVATAGRFQLKNLPPNVLCSDYLPGDDAAAIADLVICNGGSPTTNQALSAGVPILGICANLDQYLNMQAVQQNGAGRLLRAGTISGIEIVKVVREILTNLSYKTAAEKLGRAYREYDASARFAAFTDELLR